MKTKLQKRYMKNDTNFFPYRPTAQQHEMIQRAAHAGWSFAMIVDDCVLASPNAIERLIVWYAGMPRSARRGVGEQLTYNLSGELRVLFTYIIEHGISASQIINDLLDMHMPALLERIEKRRRQYERILEIPVNLGN